MEMARSLVRVHTHTHTHTYIYIFRANLLAIKSSKAFSDFRNNIKGIEYSYL